MRINENKWYLMRMLPVYYRAITVNFLQVDWSTTKSH